MSVEAILEYIATVVALIKVRLRRRELRLILPLAVGVAGVVAITHRVVTGGATAQVAESIVSSVALMPATADQLLENLTPQGIDKPRFEKALAHAVKAGQLSSDMVELRTPDGTPLRVRVYFVR